MSEYSEAQKLVAIEIVNRNGGMTQLALTEIRMALDNPTLPKSTVWRWLRPAQLEKMQTTPEGKARAAVKLDDLFEQVAEKYLQHALKDRTVDRMSGGSAVMAAAVATDKMRLIRGMPTEIVQIMPVLIADLTKLGQDPVEFFKIMGDKIALALDRAQLQGTPTPNNPDLLDSGE